MKKSTKKCMTLLCCTGLFAGILAGCSSNRSDNSSIKSSSKEVTVTFLVDNQTVLDGWKAVSANIEKKYHIKSEFELRPGGSEGDNMLKTRLATGDADDIVAYNSGALMQALNPKRYFVDVTNEPYMKNVRDDFKKAVSVNGKVYGIPYSNMNVGGWLYNKKVFKELGLSVPKTWDELMANNERIKAVGKTAVIGTYKDNWTSQMIPLADNYNVIAEDKSFAEDLTANKAKFATTLAALRSFEKLSEVNKKGYLNKDFLTTTYENGLKMLADGKGVQWPILSSALLALKKDYPDKVNNIGFFPQPSDSPDVTGITVWMPGAFYINKNTQHLDAVKKWIEYFLSPEGRKTYLEHMNISGPLAIKGAKLPDNVIPAVKDMLPYFNSGKTVPALEFLSPLKGPNLMQITKEVGSGMTSPKDGAALYDKDLGKQAKQLSLKGW